MKTYIVFYMVMDEIIICDSFDTFEEAHRYQKTLHFRTFITQVKNLKWHMFSVGGRYNV